MGWSWGVLGGGTCFFGPVVVRHEASDCAQEVGVGVCGCGRRLRGVRAHDALEFLLRGGVGFLLGWHRWRGDATVRLWERRTTWVDAGMGFEVAVRCA